MRAGGNDFNYFPENQLTKFSVVQMYAQVMSGNSRTDHVKLESP